MSLNLFTLSVEQVSNYINYGLIGLVVLALIGFLIGFFRGIYKESVSLIYFGVSFTLLICLMPQIAKWFYHLDVSFAIKNGGEMFQGVTSLGSLIEKYITDYIVSNQLGSVTDALHFANSVSLSVLSLVLYIVFSIVIILLEFLIAPLLYHLIFKWFVKKSVRKKHKLKGVSGLMRLTSTVVVFGLFIAPFTALATTTVNQYKDSEGKLQLAQKNDNDIYTQVANVLEGYNKSLLANMLYALSTTHKGLDVELMNQITKTTLDNGKVIQLFDEIGTLGSVLVEGLATGALDVTNKTINITTLVQSDFIKNAFYSLSESSMITTAFPIALTLAVNGMGNNVHADFSQIELTNVDWSDSIKSFGNVFDALKQTGYIEESIKNPSQMMDNIIISRDIAPYLHNALDQLGTTELMKCLMPQLMASYLKSKHDEAIKEVPSTKQAKDENKNNNIYANLPEEAFKSATYEDISWSEELTSMLDIVLDINDQFKTINNKDLSLKDVTTIFTPENVTSVLLGIDPSRTYLNVEDYDNNVYLNGGTVNNIEIKGTKSILGVKEEATTSKGIFDLSLVKKVLFDFDLMSEYVPSLFGDTAKEHQDIIDQIKEVIKNWNVEEWKKEFRSLLNLTCPLQKTKQTIDNNEDMLLAISEGEGNIALEYISLHMDDSYFMSELVPSILSDYTKKAENDKELFVGIKASDLNFTNFTEGSSFSHEFNYLVTDVIKKGHLIRDVENSKHQIDTIIDNKLDFITLLEGVYQSEILNRVLTEEEKTQGLYSNFEEVMINLFVSPTQEQIDAGTVYAVNIPTLTDGLLSFNLDTIVNIDDTVGWVNQGNDGEIASIFNVIGSLKKDDIPTSTDYLYRFIIGELPSIDDKVFKLGNEIERIFNTVDESVLMKEAFPTTLNKTLINNETMNTYVDFGKVEEWSLEGTYFRSVLDQLDSLGLTPESDMTSALQSLDDTLLHEFEFKLDPELMLQYHNNYDEYVVDNSNTYQLLDAIDSTSSFDLNSLLYDTVVKVFDTDPSGSVGQLISDEALLAAEEDFKFEEKTIAYDSTNPTSFVTWKYDSTNHSYPGEIYNLSLLLTYSSSITKIETVEPKLFTEILNANMKAYPFRKIVSELSANSMRNVRDTAQEQVIKNILSENYFDYQALDRLSYNYRPDDEIVDRKSELEARLQEANALSNLFELKGSFANIDQILNITNGGINSTFSKILSVMHGSEFFNSSEFVNQRNASNKRTKFSSFEAIFNEVVALKSELISCQLTLDEFDYLHNKQANDGWLGENGEIVHFNDAIGILKALDTSKVREIQSYTVRLAFYKYLDANSDQVLTKCYNSYKENTVNYDKPMYDWINEVVADPTLMNGKMPAGVSLLDLTKALMGQ